VAAAGTLLFYRLVIDWTMAPLQQVQEILLQLTKKVPPPFGRSHCLVLAPKGPGLVLHLARKEGSIPVTLDSHDLEAEPQDLVERVMILLKSL
jgi:hypothetical protein